MTFASLLAFAGLCLLLSLTPGPDTFLVLRTSLNRISAGLATAAGCSFAGIIWALLVGVGLAAVLEQSAELFRWLKIAGGLYLLYLGVSAFLRGRHERARAAAASTAGSVPAQQRSARTGILAGFGAGALSTLLNPKVGLFYLAVVPQFIPHGGNSMVTALVLGAIEAVIGGIYLCMVAVAAAKAMGLLRKPKVNLWLERVSNTIIGALGLGVIVSGATSS